MPVARFEMPDGRIARFEVPDGTTPEQAQSMIAAQFAPKGRMPDALDNPNMATDGMSGFQKGAAGLGKSIMDTWRGLGQLVGAVSADDVKSSRQRDRALMDTGAGMAGNIFGNVGMALAPGGALKGVGMAMRAAGAPSAAGVSLLGGSLMAPKTIGGALGVGAGMGAIQPAEDWTERAGNATLGALASAVVPGLLRAGSTLKASVEPFYQSGRDQILSRAMREAAGGTQHADDALAKLRAAAQPAVGPFRQGAEKTVMGELVPGSLPTTAQAAGNPGLAALERAASATNPAVTVDRTARLAAQNDARIGAIQNMAGSDGMREFARTELQSTADDLYKQAFDKGMNLARDSATGRMLSKAQQAARKGEITKLMKNPYIAEAADDARKLMQGSFKSSDDALGSVEGLHFVKKALDDKIAKSVGNEQRIIIGARDRLLTSIDALSPEYSSARAVFRDMAKPVNQMDTVAEIAKRSITPKGEMTFNKYARALSDDSAASAQGFKKATLEGTMTNEQMNILNAIKDDLARADFAQNAGRGVGSDTVQKLAHSNILNQAGVPTFLKNFAPSQVAGNLLARGGDLAYRNMNERMSEQLARAMLDPATAASLLGVRPNQTLSLLGNAAARGGASLGMMTPGLLNAQKQ